jgi:hypothetical protein
MDGNDDEGSRDESGAPAFFASKLAPTDESLHLCRAIAQRQQE